VPERARLGIMQPYFFPYLGHFGLIASVDRWVVFDVTQYTPKTWMNRNRVLHASEPTWTWVTVPVRDSSQHKVTREVLVHDPRAALASVRGKLAHYRKRAPHYDAVIGLVEEAFSERAGDSLAALDASALKTVCAYLTIPFDYSICSELGLDLDGVEHAGQWALRIAEQLGAAEYVNPLGGRELFRPAEFARAGIELSFFDMAPMQYDTGPYAFIPSLSVLDVLMWNHPAEVRAFIDAHRSVTAAETLDRA
jgi:hypothetical protein